MPRAWRSRKRPRLTIRELRIGIDDTDSLKGGCTTYVAYRVIKGIAESLNLHVTDYPYLVRLNPNFPPKTKGNGAVRLAFRADDVDPKSVIDAVAKIVGRHSRLQDQGTEPAIAVSTGRLDNRRLYDFYKLALAEVIPHERAVRLADELGIKMIYLKDSKKGAVGSLAALGADLSGDHTFELLAYRVESMWGKRRLVDERSVIMMDRETSPLTFNNYDYANCRVLITPHGPDPVLVGIRGETPHILLKALGMLEFGEQVGGHVIFKTNQGTDAHFEALGSDPAVVTPPFSVACFSGTVLSGPKVMRGGHVLFSVDSRGSEVPVVCFAESGELTKKVNALEPGDRVRVCGGTRIRGASTCLNLEKLTVDEVIVRKVKRPPLCPRCGKRSKSKGLRQGYVCPRCGRLFRRPQIVTTKRNLRPGVYLPDAGAMRHLAKPLSRVGLEKAQGQPAPLIDGWLR